jgi:hypothetical protein
VEAPLQSSQLNSQFVLSLRVIQLSFLTSVSVVSPHLYSNLHNIRRPTSSKVANAADGHSLSISAEGELGPLPSVLLADNIRHNCISILQLCDQGYTIIAFNSNFY